MSESKYLLERRERMLGIKAPEEKKQFKAIPKKSAKMKVDLKAYNKINGKNLAGLGRDQRRVKKEAGLFPTDGPGWESCFMGL